MKITSQELISGNQWLHKCISDALTVDKAKKLEDLVQEASDKIRDEFNLEQK